MDDNCFGSMSHRLVYDYWRQRKISFYAASRRKGRKMYPYNKLEGRLVFQFERNHTMEIYESGSIYEYRR